jgi:hypothetical protein
LTEAGWLVATVEQRKSFPDRKQTACPLCGHRPLIEIKGDLFGCFDLVAEHPQLQERAYVQVTSYANHAARRNKILASMETKLLLLAGARVVIHSWRKDEDRGRWVLRAEEITLRDFRQAFNYPSDVKGLREIRRREKLPDLPLGASLPF